MHGGLEEQVGQMGKLSLPVGLFSWLGQTPPMKVKRFDSSLVCTF